jgi:apolipoprotein D and lipocalin family protein
MLKRVILSAVALAVCALASPGSAAPSMTRIDLGQIMGRWYEVARTPNMLQRGCEAATSDWTRSADGFAVVQACHKGAPNGPLAQWKARARVADPATNAIFKMSFFGGLVSQEYRVLDHSVAEGWLVLATGDGKYIWLMSQKPTLPAAIRNQALARIKALGFDISRLEFPPPARS